MRHEARVFGAGRHAQAVPLGSEALGVHEDALLDPATEAADGSGHPAANRLREATLRWEGWLGRFPDVPPVVVRSLSLAIPGAGQIVQHRTALGLFFLASSGLCIALAWAILETFDRLALTLPLLGSSVSAAFGALLAIYGTAAVIHLAGVLTTVPAPTPCNRPRLHPAIPGTASLLVPGWGQLLNGDRVRAALFLAGAWIVAGIWILVSPAATALVNAYLPAVGPLEQIARQPTIVWMAKWTTPLLVWSLAVYDATASAAGRR